MIWWHGQARRKASGLSAPSPSDTQAKHTSGFPLLSLADLTEISVESYS
ncbi:MAG: hypothetical protein ACKVOQ_13355 [Cyclobacteriaceae bacterium]